MLDKSCKEFLNYLDTLPRDELMYGGDNDFMAHFKQPSEFYAMIRYLESCGYIEIIKTQRGAHLGVRLSHIGLHRREFGRQEILKYLADKWVDILALVVSLIALLISILSLVSKTPMQ